MNPPFFTCKTAIASLLQGTKVIQEKASTSYKGKTTSDFFVNFAGCEEIQYNLKEKMICHRDNSSSHPLCI